MEEKYIAVIDSGLGGLSVLALLKKEFPAERFLYFGDNDNAPYGEKTETELLFLTMRNLDYILQFGVKAIVVACNTLSVTLLPDIREYSGLKTFGVFPPVHKYLIAGEKTLLLCTPLTAKKYLGTPGLYILALPTLAREVEKNALCLNNIKLDEVFSAGEPFFPADDFLSEKEEKRTVATIFDHRETAPKRPFSDLGFKFDTVICGCTHYSLIKNRIFDHLKPKKIVCAEEFTARMLKREPTIIKSSANSYENDVLFVGKNAVRNEIIYRAVVNTVDFGVKKFEKCFKNF